MTVTVRAASRDDRAFIGDAWLNTMRASCYSTRQADFGNFRAATHREVDTILADSGTETRVASSPDDENTILGFLVRRGAGQHGLLHMLFVKKPFRRQGIARQLLSGITIEGSTLTHWTRDVSDWIWPKYTVETGYRDGRGHEVVKHHLKYDPNWREGIK